MDSIEERFINLEIALANCEKVIEDLNFIIIEQGKAIDMLIKQQKNLVEILSEGSIKSLAEETPPPHY